jgi:hypothetical protein
MPLSTIFQVYRGSVLGHAKSSNMAAVTINRIYKTGVKDAYRAIFPHILTF